MKQRIGRYFLYVIGEIFLVVIGILIALQINNSNEEKKEFKKQNILLTGLKEDLESDLNQIKDLKQLYIDRLIFFKNNYPQFKSPTTSLTAKNANNIKRQDIIYRPPSFEFSTGTYQAILNSGESIIFRNMELFNEMQEIHEKIIKHLSSIYETIKTSENQVNWKWNELIQDPDFENLEYPKEFFMDLAYFHDQIALYLDILTSAERYMKNLIKEIDNELKKTT